MEKQVSLRIYGRVQMVMFRDFVQRKARKLGLKGWVRNHTNGTVEVVAEGEENNLKKIIKLCYNGPILAKVQKVEIEWEKKSGQFDKLEIRY